MQQNSPPKSGAGVGVPDSQVHEQLEEARAEAVQGVFSWGKCLRHQKQKRFKWSKSNGTPSRPNLMPQTSPIFRG